MKLQASSKQLLNGNTRLRNFYESFYIEHHLHSDIIRLAQYYRTLLSSFLPFGGPTSFCWGGEGYIFYISQPLPGQLKTTIQLIMHIQLLPKSSEMCSGHIIKQPRMALESLPHLSYFSKVRQLLHHYRRRRHPHIPLAGLMYLRCTNQIKQVYKHTHISQL